MRKIYLIAFLLILLAFNFCYGQKGKSSSPNFGIGFKLGDPSGLSLKKYFGANALEINIGRSYMFQGGSRYYDKRFNHWYEDWYREYPHYKDFDYIGYKRTFPLSIQVHYIFQKDLQAVENLQWYWGVGGQVRFQRYDFNYRYKLDGSPDWYYSHERQTDLDLGVDGVLGLEYTLPSAPISIFTDINLFMEVADNPFAFWFQGGIGARYNF